MVPKPIPRSHGVLLAGLALAACGSEDPSIVDKDGISLKVKASAISLEDALRQKLLRIETRKNNSTREEMALSIEPLVQSQPWIRIDPGWQVVGGGPDSGGYVTYMTRYVRLPKRDRYMVSVPHVQRNMAKETGISTQSELAKMENEELMALFGVVNNMSEPLDWKLVQIATWALTENVSFSALRPPPNDGRVHLSGNRPSVDAAEILQVLDLLARLGRNRVDFALYTDAMDELDRLVEQYESYLESNDGRALVPYKRICEFYPFENAADIVQSAFDRHGDEGGSVYRRRAFEVLRDDGRPAALAVIRRVADYEQDQALFKDMQEALKGTAAPGK